DENIAEIEQLGSGRSPGSIALQDRIGREQRREHDHVAEDEDPEPISDDDALRGWPTATAPARELGWNRDWSSLDCCDRHAGSLTSPRRARSICATSAAVISCSRSMLQPAIRTTVAAARKLRIANHQMCQINEKPMTVAKKAVMKPAGLLRGISIAS